MKNNPVFSAICSVCRFYSAGFREMRLGRSLWLIIIIKLFIIFVVLKLFFFPNYISTHAPEGEEASFVANEILNH